MNQPIYLDYAATTPILTEVSTEMIRCLHIDGDFANPASRSHQYGLVAEQRVEQARADVAALVHAQPAEIIWTSGATEATNLALKGILDAYKNQHKHIITSQIEHKSVLDTCALLERQGFAVTYLAPAANTGLIDVQQVAAAIQPNTVLISLMMVNNELGTVTDIQAIGALAKQHDILLHVDAAQAVGKRWVDVEAMQIDLMSLSAHKIYGPKGIGALYVRQAVQARLQAQVHGGGHERGLRSGTLATHQIVGMGSAYRLAAGRIEAEQQRLAQIRRYLIQELQALTPVLLNGAAEPYQVANYLNMSFYGPHAAWWVEQIKNLAAVSSSSACNSKQMTPSYVLLALGRSTELAKQSIRFSFGHYSRLEDIQALLQHLKQQWHAYRPLSFSA
ncbi:cysteine desulfurase family protein [Acinetobacter larvae]|uniref:cysteine desulfurase n=1 Tax=Acinetobacter larvae TaxID=1789224 RepID=A0A1B2LVT8_9GAMM|nr:aminotransferase class V-fold PLP-dependent enzyme [Acinetobacter larvae]AOA57047.1 IscS subfamily cysteine desulfurase [Acinetobacter larvae]